MTRLSIIMMCVLVVGYFVVSWYDFIDSIDERTKYCEYVEQGVWPDYLMIAEEECK